MRSQVSSNDPVVLVNAAFALGLLGEDFGAMTALVDRALALNPSYARGWFVSGVFKRLAGEPDLAIERIETSLRLSPRERFGAPMFQLGWAYFVKRQFPDAAAKSLLAVQDQSGHPGPYRILAACYAHMGRLDEARAIVTRLRAITPQVMPPGLSYLGQRADHELLLSGLRLAVGETA
jgi:tetratricopeptide (TPR) repeat protein